MVDARPTTAWSDIRGDSFSNYVPFTISRFAVNVSARAQSYGLCPLVRANYASPFARFLPKLLAFRRKCDCESTITIVESAPRGVRCATSLRFPIRRILPSRPAKSISRIIASRLLPDGSDQNKFADGYALIPDRKGLKRFPLVMETPDSDKPSAEFQALADHREHGRLLKVSAVAGTAILLRRHFQ